MVSRLAEGIKKHSRHLGILLAVWGTYFIAIFSRMLEMKPNGLYSGHENVWSDWSLHISIAQIFSSKPLSEWFLYHPVYAHGAFTYPFLTNLISSLFMRADASLVFAFVFPSIVLSLLLILGLYFFLNRLLRSQSQATLAIFLFFLSGGPRFIYFFRDLFEQGFGIFNSALKDYARLPEYQWFGGNVIECILIPQRSALIGMTLASWGLYFFFRGWDEDPKTARAHRYWLCSGILLGILPIAHMHSLIVVVPSMLMLCVYLRKNWKDLLWLLVPGSILSISLFSIWIQGKIENPQFISWLPGGLSHGFLDFVSLLFKTWGLSLPLAFAALAWTFYTEKFSRLFIFGVGFYLLFSVTYLILFQPIAWDNSKLQFWCYLIFSALISKFLLEYFFASKIITLRTLGVLLIASITLMGAIRLFDMQRIAKHQNFMTGTEEISLGKQLREQTGTQDIFLTEPSHNHFVMMWAARPILLGYAAWAWNFGFEYRKTESDIRDMYKGSPQTEVLLENYKVHYVVIGPGELRDWHANESYFSCRFPLAFSNSSYRIYNVKKKKAGSESCS